jgi:hypothetical protein
MHCLTLISLWVLITTAFAIYTAAPYAEWAHSHVVWLTRGLRHDT